jgi:DNA repair exonuclease SbcCD nuclease subunit
MNTPVRLLHLSDVHFHARAQWDADPVLRALVRYLADEVCNGLAPDLVVITGDLAFAGRQDEYALARAWLEDLWRVLTTDPTAPLPQDRLLLVPGNHDVDRDRVDAVARMVQHGLLTGQDQDQIAAVLDSPDQRGTLLKRHAAYLAFYAAWLGLPQPLPWWQRRIDIRGQSLHIAGLDSAWMAHGDTDRGRLLLGRYQVHQTVLHPDGDGADWRLALLHHPWDYFAEQDSRAAQESIHLHQDLVLRGHLHETDACRFVPPDPRRACLELAAGSIYDGSPGPNAFQWIELDPNPRQIRVHFRLWYKGAWQVDRLQPGCPDGTFASLMP